MTTADAPGPPRENEHAAAPGRRDRPLDVLRADVETRFKRANAAPEKERPPRQAVLRRIAPLPVPRLVITLNATTAQGVMDQASSIPERLPPHLARFPVQIELRLDPLKDNTERAAAAAFVVRLGAPYILTLRAAREGGAVALADTERQWLLAHLISAIPGPAPAGTLLDLEAASLATDPAGWKGIVQAAQDKGIHLLLSHHDHEASPRDPDALIPPPSLLDDAPGGAAVIYKSATTPQDWHQELAVLVAMAHANRDERAHAIMAMGRPTARLLAPFFRAPLVYAAADAAHPAAPGQGDFRDILATWWRWGVRPRDAGLSGPGGAHESLPPRLVLLGRPALHSLSPAMQNAALRHLGRKERYLPLEPSGTAEAPTLLAETLGWAPRLGIVGGNATTPFKEALAQRAEHVDAAVQALGAANTFRIDADGIHATNTDPEGVRRPIEAAGIKPNAERVLILGAGAAARASAYALRDAERLTITNRSEERARKTQASLEQAGIETHSRAWAARAVAAQEGTLILQCTSVGLAGLAHAGESPLPVEAFRAGQTVFELVYDPLETPLLAAARAAGANVIDGLQMLLAQGAAALTYWTGCEPPRDVMRQAVLEAMATPLPMSLRPPQGNGTRHGGTT